MSEPQLDLFTAGLDPGSLAGRVMVVMAAGSPLGRQTARTLAHLGARVVVTGAAGAETLAALTAAGGEAALVQAVPDDPVSLSELAAQAQDLFGPIDAVVGEAFSTEPTPFLRLDLSGWDAQVSASLRRAYLAAQAFLPAMLTRRQGTLLAFVVGGTRSGLTAVAAAQSGLAGFYGSLAAEFAGAGVRVLALGLPSAADATRAAGAAALLLARPAPERDGPLAQLSDVLDDAGPTVGAASSETSRAARLERALELTQQLAILLADTDTEFDRLPISVRPLARGEFLSKVGHRSQDVLRAVHRLGDQLQRMQVSHSGTDTEFQIDYPSLAALFERLVSYYQAVPREASRVTDDQAVLGQLQRQMAGRQSLLLDLIAALAAINS